MLTYLQGGHNGGDLQFGPDGMLYISTGDAGDPNPPDPFNTGQDISDLLSSILRIDVDHKDEGKNYAVPRDNPFVGMKGARPEVWAYGLRNPWRMGFDRQTGELYVGDVGWELWESIHRVEKGGNYGWSAMEGPQPIKPNRVGPTPILPPLIELPHTISCSVTGGRVYRGKKFPELRGAYLFGDWETRRLWAARFEGDRCTEMPEIAKPSVRIVAFGEDRDGELYFLDYDGGTLHTIERNDAAPKNNDFPTKLSQTGLFASVKDQAPAAGVVPFAVNSRQWQDGATAEHWVALPGESSATLYEPGKPIPGMVDWHNFRLHFPKDAVLVRTLSLGGRRLETQLLHFDGLDWRAYTFAWRDDQADADLVPADGDEKEVSDGKRKRVWQIQSRSQCMSCHSSWSEYALAFQPEQLNRPGPDGRNQLVALTEAGLIRRAGPDDAAAAAVRRRLGGEGTQARRPRGRGSAAGGPRPLLPARELRALPLRRRGRGGGPAAPVPRRRRGDEGGRRPARARRLRAPAGVRHQGGRPVRQHPVFPHVQVRPRPDAAHRLGAAGRGGVEADRRLDRGHGRRRAEAGPLRGRRVAGQGVDRPEIGPGCGAEGGTRRAGTGRTGPPAVGGGQGAGRPDPRPVRGLLAHGRDGAA